MAMQVAAITVGAGGAALAVAAEAQAEPAVEAAPVADGVKPVAPSGWSCWGGPISRGPAAPPAIATADFERLLAEVPS